MISFGNVNYSKFSLGLFVIIGLILVGSALAASVEQQVKVNVVPGVIDIYSPVQGGVYDSRMIPLNLTMSSKATFRYAKYSDNGNEFVTLCRDCDEYGFWKLKRKPFDDGSHRLLIKLIFEAGEVESFVDFIVDSKMPRIFATGPEDYAVSKSEFWIEYSEENLQSITLYYGLGTESATKTDCESGKKKKCIFENINLSQYDGEEIEYWFEVKDYFETVKSRKNKIKVDVSSPELFVTSPSESIYERKVPFNISVSESVELEYREISDSSRWKKICSRCDEYGAEKLKKKLFGEGEHEIIIRATDEAGNTAEEKINFCVGGDCAVEPEEPLPECSVDGDCQADYYSENYCISKNVASDLHDFICWEKKCTENIATELIEECSYNCENGVCLEAPICLLDSDCGEISYELFCNNSDLVNRTITPDCIENICENIIFDAVNVCEFGCENGVCLEEPVPSHDVALINFTNSVNGIFLEYENGTDILDETPVLSCEEVIKAKIKIENQGDYNESVSFNGSLNGVAFSLNDVDNLIPGSSTTRTSLTPYIIVTSSVG